MPRDPITYAFIIKRDDAPILVHLDADPEPQATLQALTCGCDLYDLPGTPGYWSTEDGRVSVERYVWANVGSLPEDHAGVGVPVVLDRVA